MRVLHIAKYYPPAVGGIEAVVAGLAEGAARHGHQVTVLASRRTTEALEEDRAGVHVVRVRPLLQPGAIPLSAAFFRRLDGLAVEADVVHVHVPNPSADLLPLLGGPAWRDRPLVVTFHADQRATRWGAVARLAAPFHDRLLGKASSILVTSPASLDAVSLRRHRGRLRVVPLGIDAEEWRRVPRDPGFSRRLAALRAGKPAVLFVGRLSYYKGVHVLVEALRDVPEATAWIVGDGEERERLASLVARHGLAGRVHFLGALSRVQLAEAYRAATALVLPSVSEGEAFGMVQLEAMAFGLPVVNTRLPTGVPWVSQDGISGLTVRPGDPADLALALHRVLEDSTLRDRFGKGGLGRVEAFHHEKILDQVLAAYGEAVTAGGRRSRGSA